MTGLLPSNLQEPVLANSEIRPDHHSPIDLTNSDWRQDINSANAIEVQQGASQSDNQFNDNATTMDTNDAIPCFDTTEAHESIGPSIYPSSNDINMSIDGIYNGAMSFGSQAHNLGADVMAANPQFSFSPMPFGGSTQDWLDLDPFGIMDDFQSVLPSSTQTNLVSPHHATWSVPNSSHVLPAISRDQQLDPIFQTL